MSRLLLLALLPGCSLFTHRADCEALRGKVVFSWDEVAGFFERMAALEEGNVEAAEAEARHTQTRRESAEGAAEAWRYRQNTGMVDLRSGREIIDPDVARVQGRKARSASASASRMSDDEELQISEAIAARDVLEDLLDSSARAAQIRDLARTDVRAAAELAEQNPDLDATELAPRARQITAAWLEQCGD